MRSDLDENGKPVSTGIRADLNLGSQEIFTDEIVDQTCLGALGIYNLGKVKLEAFGVRSNIPPQGPMAGFGLSQGFFAIERHVSRIADSLHQDPAEWRKNNFIDKNNNLAIGIPIKDHVPMAEIIDTAAAMGDYYRKWASFELLRSRRQEKDWNTRTEPIRGIGMAAAYQGAGFLYAGGDKGACSVEVTLQKDSTLEIKTSMVSSGGDYSRIWRSIAAEELSVEAANVKVINIASSPDSGPATLSRDITTISRLVEKCCQAIRKQRFRDPLPITVRRSIKIEKLNPWGMENSTKTVDPGAFAHCGWGASAVEIEIDPVSLYP
jgi:CO/xanthine dehydrogenase Mo-binding subunit